MYKEKIDSRTVVADYLLRRALNAVQKVGIHPNDRGAVIAGYMQSVSQMLGVSFGTDVDAFVTSIKAECDRLDARRRAQQ